MQDDVTHLAGDVSVFIGTSLAAGFNGARAPDFNKQGFRRYLASGLYAGPFRWPNSPRVTLYFACN